MTYHEPLKERARGCWQGILPSLGVSTKSLRNRHGPCPLPGCGGKDRFRFDDKGGYGTWICNQCGAGDGIEFVKRLKGLEFKEAAALIEPLIGGAPVQTGSIGKSTDASKRAELGRIWKRASLITLDDVAGKYLYKRAQVAEFPQVLRFSKEERYFDDGAAASWHPAMIALVEPSDAAKAEGQRPILHRTYLDTFGAKADVPNPRKMLGTVPTGAAVRLMPHADVLGIAEGIETAFSAAALFNVPVWAALTADILQEWQPPEGVSVVMIYGDHDASFTGQAAAFGLARRLKAKGLTPFVEIPPRLGDDWNDVFLAQRRSA